MLTHMNRDTTIPIAENRKGCIFKKRKRIASCNDDLTDLEDFSAIFFSARTLLQGALPHVYAHVIVLVAFRILVTVALVTLDGVT